MANRPLRGDRQRRQLEEARAASRRFRAGLDAGSARAALAYPVRGMVSGADFYEPSGFTVTETPDEQREAAKAFVPPEPPPGKTELGRKLRL